MFQRLERLQRDLRASQNPQYDGPIDALERHLQPLRDAKNTIEAVGSRRKRPRPEYLKLDTGLLIVCLSAAKKRCGTSLEDIEADMITADGGFVKEFDGRNLQKTVPTAANSANRLGYVKMIDGISIFLHMERDYCGDGFIVFDQSGKFLEDKSTIDINLILKRGRKRVEIELGMLEGRKAITGLKTQISASEDQAGAFIFDKTKPSKEKQLIALT